MVHWNGHDLHSWQREILRLEAEGRVTRTFRRLEPDRQRAVVQALLADAAEHGPQATSVKRAAARASIAVGSLYRYFPDRAGMLDLAAEVAAGYLTASLRGFIPQAASMPLREGLTAYLSAGVSWTDTHSDLLAVFLRAAYQGSEQFGESLVRPVARALRELLSALLAAAHERGELRPDVDLAVACRLVLVMTTAVIDAELLPYLDRYYLLFDEDHPPPLMQAATVDFIVAAIGRRPTSGQ